MSDSIIKLLIVFFMAVASVHVMEKNEYKIDYISKAVKDWNQIDLEDALDDYDKFSKDCTKLRLLSTSYESVEFSTEKFNVESLNRLKKALETLKIKAIIGMQDANDANSNVSFIMPLTMVLRQSDKIEISNRKYITSLIIPAGMKSLQTLIVSYNQSLKSLTLPDGMVKLKMIDIGNNPLITLERVVQLSIQYPLVVMLSDFHQQNNQQMVQNIGLENREEVNNPDCTEDYEYLNLYLGYMKTLAEFSMTKYFMDRPWGE